MATNSALLFDQVETVEEKQKRGKSGYRLELEFMSDHGYYRMPCTEAFVVGEANKAKLMELEQTVRNFMGI